MPLNALLGIDQFIKAKYLLKTINVYNVEMNGVVKPLMWLCTEYFESIKT